MKIDSNKYIGISLSGGKNEKTFLARLDYYKNENRLVLTSLRLATSGNTKTSADKKLIDDLLKIKNLKSIGIDTPTQLPTCVTCKLKCPGYEKCKVPSIKYMRRLDQQTTKKKKKMFTPYTERAVEYYLNSLDKNLFLPPALGANFAPLTARTIFLKKHFKSKLKEVYPTMSFVRLAKDFGMAKKYVYAKRLSEEGDEARLRFLTHLSDRSSVFMYYHDVQYMVDNPFAFTAFLVALCTYLESRKMTEPRPKALPKSESWVLIPKPKVAIF